MDAPRVMVGSLLEWIIAAGCIFGVLAMGARLLTEFRSVTAVTSVIAHEASVPENPPAAVPSRAVSVPMLLLPDGVEVHVGDTADQVESRLGRDAEIAAPSIDRMPEGPRVTRFYERAGTRFIVVLHSPAGDTQARVTAIYLE